MKPLPPIAIDLYSDTLTTPTPAMRRAMARAEVGDEQKGEDPTVNRLHEMVAELLGKEAALFLPSGTMCNLIGISLHTRPGDEVIIEARSHPVLSETGGPAAISGVMLRGIATRRGVFTAADVEAAVRADIPHNPRTALVSVENTHNFGGGTCWPLETLRAVTTAARKHKLRLHMDGARLLNAVVATGISAKTYAAAFDTVWIDFSKGLGAPVGACIAGSRELMKEARRLKQRFGGAMRQAGIIAAAGVHALRHHVARLAEDHANAKRLAESLAEIRGIALDPREVETNIVIFDVRGLGVMAEQFVARARGRGVRFSMTGPSTVRAVTHLDVSRRQIDRTLKIVRELFAS
ncbi:MAG: threonine aldolase family protein [Verrucomicrobia bacterium]|nr:threonine aldolase family protein [Verrucomicrobiota bacterium]